MKLLITWFAGIEGQRERRLLVDGSGDSRRPEYCDVDSLGAISWRPDSGGPSKEILLTRAIAGLDANGKYPPRVAGTDDVFTVAIGTFHNGTWFEGDWRGSIPKTVAGKDSLVILGPDGPYR